MTTYYVDTSALAKRYINETGSAWVLSWVEPPAGNIIVVCDITPVEMFSLLQKRLRQGQLGAANVVILQNDFLAHAEQEYLAVPLDDKILAHARSLVTKYKLRTLDAIQLASALDAAASLGEAITFVAADVDLLAAASAEGFAVDDPNAHP
ncbi:MAG: type II toxin-antitoxin system VapC family toxin [Anaerolineae bacterium]|nr:type II toxin-antitoxin system VapC family toxin [Anaerolineae bacterium]